jgi:hypothetical protein
MPRLPRHVPPRGHVVAHLDVAVVDEEGVLEDDAYTVVPIWLDAHAVKLVVRRVAPGAPEPTVAVRMSPRAESAKLILGGGPQLVVFAAVGRGGTRVVVPWRVRTWADVLGEAAAADVVPPLLHQTDASSECSTEALAVVETLLDMNPRYDYRFYDDGDVEAYLHRTFGEHSREYEAHCWLEPGAYRADLFRYAVLHQEGGAYADIKLVALAPLEAALAVSVPLLVQDTSDDGRSVYQAVLAARKGCPLMAAARDEVVATVAQRSYGRSYLDVSGPDMLGRLASDAAWKRSGYVFKMPDQPWTHHGHLVRVADAARTPLFRFAYAGYRAARGPHYSDLHDAKAVYQYVEHRGRRA